MTEPKKNLSSWASEFLEERLSKAAETMRKPELVQELRSKLGDVIDSLPGAAQREVDRFLTAARQRAASFADMLHPDDSINTATINASGVLLHRQCDVSSPMPLLQSMMFQANNQHPTAYRSVHRALDAASIELTGQHALVAQNLESAILAITRAERSTATLIVPRSQAIQLPSGISLPDLLRAAGRDVIEVGSVDGWSIAGIQNELPDATSEFGLVTADRIGGPNVTPWIDKAELASGNVRRVMHVCTLASPTALDDVLNVPLPTLRSRGTEVLLVTAGNGLLGGPASGIIIGNHDTLKRIEVSRDWAWLQAELTTVSAIVIAMRCWIDEQPADDSIRAMLQTTHANLVDRASRLKNRLEQEGFQVTVRSDECRAGVWADTDWSLPSVELQISQPPDSDAMLMQRLSKSGPHLLTKIQGERLVLDLRWVPPAHDSTLAKRILSLATTSTADSTCE